MYYLQHYVIDWDKVNSIDDLKRLIAVMCIAFEPDNPHLHFVRDLVKRQDKNQPLPMPSVISLQDVAQEILGPPPSA